MLLDLDHDRCAVFIALPVWNKPDQPKPERLSVAEHDKNTPLQRWAWITTGETLGALFFWITFIVVFYIPLKKGSIQVKNHIYAQVFIWCQLRISYGFITEVSH